MMGRCAIHNLPRWERDEVGVGINPAGKGRKGKGRKGKGRLLNLRLGSTLSRTRRETT